jgi:uncharacterized protein with HEPN domain
MTPEAHRRLGHALQAIQAIQKFTGSAPLQPCFSDDLIRSAVLRQLGIVQEALRVALLEEPSLRQIWPQLDSWLEACTRMRDWQHPVALEELVGFVAGDLQVWQGRLMAGMEQAGRGGEGGSADCRKSEGLGYEF